MSSVEKLQKNELSLLDMSKKSLELITLLFNVIFKSCSANYLKTNAPKYSSLPNIRPILLDLDEEYVSFICFMINPKCTLNMK